MADVINLKTARKAKARAEKETTAAANRAKFGQSKAAKLLLKAQSQKAETDLDGHKC